MASVQTNPILRFDTFFPDLESSRTADIGTSRCRADYSYALLNAGRLFAGGAVDTLLKWLAHTVPMP